LDTTSYVCMYTLQRGSQVSNIIDTFTSLITQIKTEEFLFIYLTTISESHDYAESNVRRF